MKRVVQWSAGGVGKLAARALFEHDDFDPVCVLVHSDDKPWHITTTQSVDDIVPEHQEHSHPGNISL